MGEVLSLRRKKLDTILLQAREKGLVDRVKRLLDDGAEVNAKNENGWTPLIVASFFGYQNIVRLLLDRGANPFLKDNDVWTAEKWAEYMGYEVIKQILKEGIADRHELGKQLLLVVASGNVEDVAKLTARGANVNIQGCWPLYETPLIVAAREGHTTILRLLLSHGTKVDSVDIMGRTALYFACERGHIEIVRLLLENGADPNHEDEDGFPPCSVASHEAYLEINKFLSKQMPEK